MRTLYITSWLDYTNICQKWLTYTAALLGHWKVTTLVLSRPCRIIIEYKISQIYIHYNVHCWYSMKTIWDHPTTANNNNELPLIKGYTCMHGWHWQCYCSMSWPRKYRYSKYIFSFSCLVWVFLNLNQLIVALVFLNLNQLIVALVHMPEAIIVASPVIEIVIIALCTS